MRAGREGDSSVRGLRMVHVLDKIYWKCGENAADMEIPHCEVSLLCEVSFGLSVLCPAMGQCFYQGALQSAFVKLNVALAHEQSY